MHETTAERAREAAESAIDGMPSGWLAGFLEPVFIRAEKAEAALAEAERERDWLRKALEEIASRSTIPLKLRLGENADVVAAKRLYEMWQSVLTLASEALAPAPSGEDGERASAPARDALEKAIRILAAFDPGEGGWHHPELVEAARLIRGVSLAAAPSPPLHDAGRMGELEEALKPFAEAIDAFMSNRPDDVTIDGCLVAERITWGHLRRASALVGRSAHDR